LNTLKTKNEKLSFTDNVAGIHNQYFFFESGTIILQLAKRNKVPLSMVVIDIDDLGELNEKYSYEISNKIIRSVAKTLKQKCRKSDLVSYLGDGRFGLLLYNISGINTNITLDTLRKKIEYNKYRIKNNTFNITASIGASVIHAQMNEDTLEVIYDKAYLATNAAKGKGKNCVVVY
jgi:diguanylate cyclase (GGDEF)-like protein